jgi:hypothetical protein
MWPLALPFSLLLVSAAPQTSTPSCRAAVLDLQPGEGITSERARALTEMVTTEVGAHLGCSVLSRTEIEGLMNFEVARQTGGCDTDSCIAELGEALGVSRLVLGTIQRVDDDVLVSLRLVDMEGMHVLRRVTDATRHDDALLRFVGWLARRLALGDEAAGPRPVDDTRVLERRASLWRTLAVTGVISGGAALALGVMSGGATLVAQEALTELKTARVVDRSRVESVEAAGPWLAGGANLGLYLGATLVVLGGALFFLPGEDMLEAAP